VLLVTLAEETPVNELVETAFALEDRVGVSLGPVVVNGLYPDVSLDIDAAGAMPEADRRALVAAAAFREDRVALQREQVDRLAERLPLPQIHLPFLFTADLTPADVDVLTGELEAGIGAL
jgi:hypothetical protein